MFAPTPNVAKSIDRVLVTRANFIREFGKSSDILMAMSKTLKTFEPIHVTIPVVGITAFSSRHSRKFCMRSISNSFHKIVVVIEGAGSLEIGSQTVELKPDTVIRIAPHQPHRFIDEPIKPMTLTVLCVLPHAGDGALACLWPQLMKHIKCNRGAFIAPGHAAEIYALNRRIAIESSSNMPYATSMIVGLAQEAIVELLRGRRRSPVSPTKAGGTAFAGTVMWMDRHFTQPMTITDLAERAGMSYRSFTTHFHRQTGKTVTDYVSAKRIELAAHVINSGGDILQAAFEAGFGDISHFYQMFNRYTRTTPGRIKAVS